MIEFFITTFAGLWLLLLIGPFVVVGIILLGYAVLYLLGAFGVALLPFAELINAIRKRLGITTWEERKEGYKQGKHPGWFDKMNLWLEGNNENNR